MNVPYDVTIESIQFRIYDTAGLNEGDQGRVPHCKAIQNLYMLIRQLDSISLLVYCAFRGRIKDNAKANWSLFNKVICGGNVRIIAVVTGLEGHADPDEWWRDERNKGTFGRYGLLPRAVGCVVSTPGRQNEYQEAYAKSQTRLHRLIVDHHREWSAHSKDGWFAGIYREVYDSSFCHLPKSRPEYTEKMRRLTDELKKETDMGEEEFEKLKATLLKAEKKFQRWWEKRK
jgi:hypothetical protein